MKKPFIISAILVIVVSAAAGTIVYLRSVENPYTMAWDMAAHTHYGAELAQDIRGFHPLSFLYHINDSSIALWPFLHPLLLAVTFAIFGFTDQAAVLLTVAVFVLTALTAFLIGWAATAKKSVIPGLIVVFLLLTSPLYLAFSTYIMLEIFGTFFTLLTIALLYMPPGQHTRLSRVMPAVVMLLLFLTKINYGFYLLIPYLIFEAINLSYEKRRDYLELSWRYLDLKNIKSVPNILIAINIIAIIFMMFSPGFDIGMFGRTVELRGTKNLIYLLVCLLFLKCVIFYFRNRVMLREKLLPRHVSIIHMVIAPLFVWFLLSTGRPAEFIRMSSERITDYPFIGMSNIVFYPASFVREYCCHIAVGFVALVLVVIAAMRWRKNPLVIRFLLIYVLFGYIGLTLKLRNFAEPRFFFTQAVAILLTAAFELWRIGCLIRSCSRACGAAYYSAVAALIILLSILPVRHIYTDQTPEILSRSVSMSDPKLGELVKDTIAQIEPAERRIVILGGSNEISPYLIRWELVKKYPSTSFDIIEPPVKSLDSEEDINEFQSWLESRPADAIICIVISRASPFAQTTDFKTRHAHKQALVDKMKNQGFYTMTHRERSRSKAVEIRLYKSSPSS